MGILTSGAPLEAMMILREIIDWKIGGFLCVNLVRVFGGRR